MKISVKEKLDNLKKLSKSLGEADKAISFGANVLLGDLIKAWSNAKSLNGSILKSLTPKYRNTKTKTGRAGKRDLNLSGELYRAMQVKKESAGLYSVGPDGKNSGKLRGNIKADENIMRINKKEAQRITSMISERLVGK